MHFKTLRRRAIWVRAAVEGAETVGLEVTVDMEADGAARHTEQAAQAASYGVTEPQESPAWWQYEHGVIYKERDRTCIM